MSVWILKWDYPSDFENNITVWDSEEAALEQAATEIQDKITDGWDQDDPDQMRYSESISEFAKHKKYREVVQEWNDYQDNYNDQFGEWYLIWEEEVLTGKNVTPRSILPDDASYTASSPGATCRGPCKQHNNYAYADRSDGTYMCHQCSTFQHIFGAKP